MNDYKRIFDINGATRQVDKCIEEMAELIHALIRHRATCGQNDKPVIEEMADVLNTVEILMEGWGIREEVQKIQGEKVHHFLISQIDK